MAALFGTALISGCSSKPLAPKVDGGADVGGAGGGSAGQGGGDGGDGAPDGGGGAGVSLAAIEVTPASQTVTLAATSATSFSATARFTAMGHFSDGHDEEVSARAIWSSAAAALKIAAGRATISAPGTFAVTAMVDGVVGTATLIATLETAVTGGSLDPAAAAALDGVPAGPTQIAYPLGGAIVPPNLTPLSVHVARTSPAQSWARLRFTSGNVLDLSYYAACQTAAGSGCYVDLPAEITQLFVAASESQDITLVARVGGPAAATLVESAAIRLAWSNVPRSELSAGMAAEAKSHRRGRRPESGPERQPHTAVDRLRDAAAAMIVVAIEPARLNGALVCGLVRHEPRCASLALA